MDMTSPIREFPSVRTMYSKKSLKVMAAVPQSVTAA